MFDQATGYGSVTDLLGANCRHRYDVYFPGISQLQTIPDKINGMAPDEYYEATQRQRELEQHIRDTKRDIAVLEKAGVGMESPAYVQKRLILGRQQNELATFCADKGLTRQYARERAYGIGAQPKALRGKMATAQTGGTLSIKIDRFVACLEDKAGNVLKTESLRLSTSDLAGSSKRNGWFINWQTEAKTMEVYGLRLAGDTKIQDLISLVDDQSNQSVKLGWVVSAPQNRGDDKVYVGVGGHMFAIAAQRSVDLGYNGYMWGMAKNQRLLKHYIDELGATNYAEYNIYIDETAAKTLLEKYSWMQA